MYHVYKNQAIKIIGVRAIRIKNEVSITWQALSEMLNDKIEKIESTDEEASKLEAMKEVESIIIDKTIDKIKEKDINFEVKKEIMDIQMLNLINDTNINIQPLDLIFRKGEVNYDLIKEALFNKLNNYPNITELYVKITFFHEDVIKHRIYPLKNEYARNLVFNLLK